MTGYLIGGILAAILTLGGLARSWLDRRARRRAEATAATATARADRAEEAVAVAGTIADRQDRAEEIATAARTDEAVTAATTPADMVEAGMDLLRRPAIGTADQQRAAARVRAKILRRK